MAQEKFTQENYLKTEANFQFFFTASFRNHEHWRDETATPPQIGLVTHLEELFKWGVYHGVRNKRQSIEWEKLRGLAQRCPFGLQVGFKIRNPLIQVLFVLQRRKDTRLGSHAGRPVPPSIPSSLRGSSSSSHDAGFLPTRPSKHAVSGHSNTIPNVPLDQNLSWLSENWIYSSTCSPFTL